MTTPFWLSNPTILFKQEHITHLWPTQQMTSEEKLNSITRLVLLLTLLGYLITKTIKILITGLVTLAAILILYQIQSRVSVKMSTKEAFMNMNNNTNPGLYTVIKDNYTQPTVTNPAMNVLLTDIADDPDRNTAAPAYNPIVESEMNEKTQKFVSNNFNDPSIDERLFKDLGDNYEFDQSMRTWYATPNTRVMNDQKAFSEFCYGDMISCKDGDGFACTRNAPPRWTNY